MIAPTPRLLGHIEFFFKWGAAPETACRAERVGDKGLGRIGWDADGEYSRVLEELNTPWYNSVPWQVAGLADSSGWRIARLLPDGLRLEGSLVGDGLSFSASDRLRPAGNEMRQKDGGQKNG